MSYNASEHKCVECHEEAETTMNYLPVCIKCWDKLHKCTGCGEFTWAADQVCGVCADGLHTRYKGRVVAR